MAGDANDKPDTYLELLIQLKGGYHADKSVANKPNEIRLPSESDSSLVQTDKPPRGRIFPEST